MKIRIRDNSIRLRLMQGEVTALSRDGRVAGKTEFPGGAAFAYVVESSPACVAPSAAFEEGAIVVSLPEALVLPWATSTQVSMGGEQPLPGGGVLHLLVEKDFACLAPRDGEDESDMYPHPEAPAGGC